MESNRQIKIGGIISYLTIGFSIVSGLIYTPWMISIIGKSNFGLYTLATSLVVLVTVDLGLSQAVTRFVSKYRVEKDNESIKQFLGVTYKLFVFLALIFLLLLSVVYFNVESVFQKLSIEEVEKVKVLLSIAGFYAVISFPFHPLDGLIVSGEWFIFQKSVELFSKILNVVLMVIALIMGYGLYSLVIVNAISGLIIIGIKLFFLNKNKQNKIQWSGFNRTIAKDIFSFSLWIMVIKVAQRLIINITPSVLGITSGSSEIAIFSAALTIENYVWNFSTVIGTMLLPKVSGIVFGDNSKPGALLELMIKVGRIQFLTLAAIVSIFLVAGKGFFLNWLGVEFEKSYIVSVLLILPGLIIIPQETASTALVALNKVRFNAYSRLTIAFISISLTFVLSAYYGAIGSAIAIFIGNLIGGAIVLNIVYWKVLKIDIWEFFKKCQLRLVLPFILVLFIGFFLNNIVEEVSWFNTIAKISLCFMVYALSAYIFVLNKYEKSLFHGLLNRRYN